MGAKISAVHFMTSSSGLLRKGSIKLAIRSGAECLKKGTMEPSDVNLLINTGVYRDENIGEPAIAALIQQGLKANPGVREDDAPGTFSFDLANGGCGLVTGAQLIDGFMGSGTIDVGLLVTSDVDPSPSTSEDYPFVPAGGAVLFEPGLDDGEGFQAFKTTTFPQYSDMFESRIIFSEGPDGQRAANRLKVIQKKNNLARCVDCAQEAVEDFVKGLGIDIKQVDLVIPSQFPEGFPKKFRVRMGLRKSHIVDVSQEHGSLHTAGPIAALDRAMEDGRFAKAKTVLFVTVGAGITVALALYCKDAQTEMDQGALAVEEGEDDELVGMLEEDEGDPDGSEG